MVDETRVAAAPERVITDTEYTTVTKGEAVEIPEYMGIGAAIKVMVQGDKLIVDAYEPGYGTHWVGRISRITELEQENAYLRAVIEDLSRMRYP